VPLTVKDILEKTFKRSFKGYDEDEVDRFLDQVIDEFKALQAENESLKATLTETSERLSRVSETEATIMNTLVSAQKSSERLLAEAARKAELIIDSAQTTAARRAEQTKTELALAEKRLEEIKGHASQFAESFANLVNSQAASFQQAYRDYFGDPETPRGINAEAARRISADVETGLKDIGAIETVPEDEDEPAGLQPDEAEAYGPAETEPEGGMTLPEDIAEAQAAVALPDEPAYMEPAAVEEAAYAEPAAADEAAYVEPSAAVDPAYAEPAAVDEPVYMEPAAAVDPAYAEPAVAGEPAEAAPPAAFEAPEEPMDPGKGVMSLQEINRALRELEEQDGNILSDDGGEENDSRPRYNDYSWLYDGDSAEPAPEIAGKDDPELKSLIDEVID